MNGSSGLPCSHLTDQQSWACSLGSLGLQNPQPPPSCLAFSGLSWKGLSFVLGSCLAVDRGWDRTSVCCYGCRTLEGDGWIIMAMPPSEGADARNWLRPLPTRCSSRPQVHPLGHGGVR